MSELHYTDQMFSFIREHCSDKLITRCLEPVKLVPAKQNSWDISDYVVEDIAGTTITDKLNIVWCFLKNGGTVIYQGTVYKQDRETFLMTELVLNHVVIQLQEADVLMSWIDCAQGEPYFELESQMDMKNPIVVKDGEPETLTAEQQPQSKYIPIEEARRLSHERLNKSWESIQGVTPKDKS